MRCRGDGAPLLLRTSYPSYLLLELLVGEVDAELLERVALEALESKNVEDRDRGLHQLLVAAGEG